MIGSHAEGREGLFKHLLMLAGREQKGSQTCGALQLEIQRSHLDGLGARSDNQNNGLFHGWRFGKDVDGQKNINQVSFVSLECWHFFISELSVSSCQPCPRVKTGD